MAKVKVELELDWIGEDGDIDQSIRDEVISSLQSKFTVKAERRLEEMMNEKLKDASERVTDEFLTNVMAERINNLQIPWKSDDWRSEVQMLSLSEFVGKRYDRYLQMKVLDSEGNTTRYERDAKYSIHEYFVNRFLEKELVGKVSAMIKKARQEAEESIIKSLESNLKAQLSADIINRLNIPNMLKSLQEKAVLLQGEEATTNAQ